MTVTLHQGDCLEVLQSLPENSVHSVVTDPPYLLAFMGKSWDTVEGTAEMQAFHLAWAKEALRVLRPGGFLLAFAATRTYHRMVVGIEDAGFEIRDQLCWLNSQGMPHGMNLSKMIDKAAGAERKTIGTVTNTYDGCVRDPSKHGNPADQSNIGKWGLTKTPHGQPLTEPATEAAKQWDGYWSTLKPCMEPIVLAQKPLDGTIVQNALKHGTGGLNIDGCRIPVDLSVDDPRLGGQGTWSTENAAKNVYGEFAGERVGSSPLGRYPSGVLWDGSDEVKEVFDSFGEKSSGVPGKRRKPHQTDSMSGTLGILDREEVGYADKGGIHRFYKACEYAEEERRVYYCGKVSPKERNGSKHPSIKPVKLMQYLCRLCTPKGGTVLDPFAGTGTTGEAAAKEGFDVILIEREEEYIQDIRKRLHLYLDDSLIGF